MKKTQKLMLVVLFGLTYTLQAQEKRSIANFQLGIAGTVEGTSVKTPAIYGSHIALGYASGLTASLFYEFGAGGRYKISEYLHLNSEIGIGLSLLKVGVAFNL